MEPRPREAKFNKMQCRQKPEQAGARLKTKQRRSCFCLKPFASWQLRRTCRKPARRPKSAEQYSGGTSACRRVMLRLMLWLTGT